MNCLLGRLALPMLALFCLLLLCGCSKPAVGTVSGKVTYKNQPVPSGTVTFFGQGDRVESAEIQEDGSYTITKAPVGTVKIGVITLQPWAPPTKSHMPDQVPETSAVKKPFVKVPDDYRNPETSGLTYVVQPGPQTYNLELK